MGYNEMEQSIADELAFRDKTLTDEGAKRCAELERVLRDVDEFFQENPENIPAPLQVRVSQALRTRIDLKTGQLK